MRMGSSADRTACRPPDLRPGTNNAEVAQDLRCPMCQQESAAPAVTVGEGDYCACPNCGGLYLDPYPARQTNTVFEGATGAGEQQALEAARRGYFLRHLIRIEKHIGRTVQNWRLMEIGCGSGVLLQTAIARGWQADALELSPELAAIARETNPTSQITVSDVLDHTTGAGDYDAVMALDVLEHVLDPVLMLRNCCGLLKPGGLLLLQTPNTSSLRFRTQGAAWEMMDPDQHINLFSPRGLVALLGRSCFEIVSLHTVSGSGMETGAARVVAAVKQWTLDRGKLGNALHVLARRRA